MNKPVAYCPTQTYSFYRTSLVEITYPTDITYTNRPVRPFAVVTYPVRQNAQCKGVYDQDLQDTWMWDESADYKHATKTYMSDNSASWERVCEHVDERGMMWDWQIEDKDQWYEMSDLCAEKPLVCEWGSDVHDYGNGVQCDDESHLLRTYEVLYRTTRQARQDRHYAYKRVQFLSDTYPHLRKSIWPQFKAQSKELWDRIKLVESYMYAIVGELRARGYDIVSKDGMNGLVLHLDTVEHVPAPECTPWMTSDMAPRDTTESLVDGFLADSGHAELWDGILQGDYYVEGKDYTYIGEGNPSHHYIAACKREREEMEHILREAATRNQMCAEYAIAPHKARREDWGLRGVGEKRSDKWVNVYKYLLGTRSSYRVLNGGQRSEMEDKVFSELTVELNLAPPRPRRHKRAQSKKVYHLSRLETKVWAMYYRAEAEAWAKGLPLNTAQSSLLPWSTVSAIIRQARDIAKNGKVRNAPTRAYRVAKWSTSGKLAPNVEAWGIGAFKNPQRYLCMLEEGALRTQEDMAAQCEEMSLDDLLNGSSEVEVAKRRDMWDI